MKTHNENIKEKSIWNTKTHTPFSETLPLSVLEAGHFYANIDYSVNRKYHNSFLLLYTVSGSGVIQYNSKEYILPEKHAIIIDCKKPHIYTSNDTEWEFLWLHFNGNFAESMMNFLYPDEINVIRLNNQASFSYAFNKIIDELVLFDSNHCFSVSCELQSMILMLSKDKDQNGMCINGKVDVISKKAIEYMENNYSKALTVKEIAEKINLSEYHFIRIFKKTTGMSPYNYLIGVRITKAKRLLVESDLSIDEIAFMSGFNDTANFINKFRRLTGETPLKYRKAFR